ncbi:hypothetical protein C8F04DRAFT_1278925 [Mycena alexandri]|uniref:Uncharacterized protein n=1 Tax=Mycena alexandri TaxID=1745969 RepID=A0AAD6RYL1_9AGAR|nr:hypothetical protein C8F04DRAFT_1278925 [Mycena alexandri]
MASNMDLEFSDTVYTCVPPWSRYTLTDRGKLVSLPLDLLPLVEDQLEVVEDQLEVVDHRHFVESTFRHAHRLDSNLEDDNRSADSDSDAMSQTDSEPSDLGSVDGMDIDDKLSGDSSDEDAADDDYMPSPEWISGWVDHWASYLLRSRLPDFPVALADLSPIPKILTTEHLRALNFSTIKWDEPRPFTDVANRIGAFFVGPPAERTTWERTIIQASSEMYDARACIAAHGHRVLRSGVSYSAGFGRPCNIPTTEDSQLTLAHLRHSKAIQDITSYQNAMLQTIAPRLWNLGRETVDTILAHDTGLRLPFRLPGRHAHQPTAFAEVEYRFHIEDSMPRARERATGGASGWDVITSLGNYDATEGLLILWENNSVLAFPPGSTILLPTGLLTYSFTAVSEPASHMLIVQSLNPDLEYFVANGCQAEPPVSLPRSMSGSRRAEILERAEVLLGKYPTIEEFDAQILPDVRRQDAFYRSTVAHHRSSTLCPSGQTLLRRPPLAVGSVGQKNLLLLVIGFLVNLVLFVNNRLFVNDRLFVDKCLFLVNDQRWPPNPRTAASSPGS